MKIGIITWSCRFALGGNCSDQHKIPGYLSFSQFLVHTAELGLDGVMAETGYIEKEAEHAGIRELLKKYGLFCEIGGWGCSFPALESQLKLAQKLGSRVLRTAILGSGRFRHTPQERKQILRNAIKNLGRIMPEAEKSGISIAIENHQDFTARELLSVVKEIESPCCGICFDTGNSIPILQDPYRECRLLAPYVKTVHLKDFNIADTEHELSGARLYGTALGDGILDLPQQMRTVYRAAPEANWIIELQLGACATAEETYRHEEDSVVRSTIYARKLQKQLQSGL